MRINNKYKINQTPFTLKVIEAFDFREEPILLLEQDNIGNLYLSYLANSNYENNSETRIYVQISNEKLSLLFENKITIHEAFLNPENKTNYIITFDLDLGKELDTYLIPNTILDELQLIPSNYNYTFDYKLKDVYINKQILLNHSEKVQKVIFDFYLQSLNLVNSVKPYAFYKVFTPIVDIIKNFLEIDSRKVDECLSFTHLRHSSLGITIEINYSKDLFLEKESQAIEKLMLLLNAETQEDFRHLISITKNSYFIKEYATILKSIKKNDAKLNTSYANPISKEVKTVVIDKEKAQKAMVILDESFETIEDIEIIEGIFREIDIDSEHPSFKIFSPSEDISLRGKFELSLLDKLKQDYLNLGKDTYKFTIKTIYSPETTVKKEEVKRFMTDYELVI